MESTLSPDPEVAQLCFEQRGPGAEVDFVKRNSSAVCIHIHPSPKRHRSCNV